MESVKKMIKEAQDASVWARLQRDVIVLRIVAISFRKEIPILIDADELADALTRCADHIDQSVPDGAKSLFKSMIPGHEEGDTASDSDSE